MNAERICSVDTIVEDDLHGVIENMPESIVPAFGSHTQHDRWKKETLLTMTIFGGSFFFFATLIQRSNIIEIVSNTFVMPLHLEQSKLANKTMNGAHEKTTFMKNRSIL